MTAPQHRSDSLPHYDRRKAEQTLLELLAIPGRGAHEAKVMRFLTDRLEKAGVPAGTLQSDQVHRRSPHGGEVGNLFLKLPGVSNEREPWRGPRRLLVAHADTVPLCEGSKPIVRGHTITSADKATGVGADDRTGTAVLLIVAETILKSGLPHPPLTLLWTVQEELGLHGVRLGALGKLGSPKLAFNFDGGSAEKLSVGAIGGYRMEIEILGRASHAGSAPEEGVSAIVIAALAIADLQRDGWHGLVRREGSHGTCNVGVIRGGEATNVVTPRLEIRAEARSHDPAFRGRIIEAIETAFRRAVDEVRNSHGLCGEVNIRGRLDYESFHLPDDDPSVLAAAEAVRSIGGTPVRAITNGGLDANWLTSRLVPTVTLGCGQLHQHTANEAIDLREYHKACQIALLLATATEKG